MKSNFFNGDSISFIISIISLVFIANSVPTVDTLWFHPPLYPLPSREEKFKGTLSTCGRRGKSLNNF
jgi:hypothetical protein